MYRHPWHTSIAAILEQLPAQTLRDHQCYFGGGTALVLQSVQQSWKFGPEYRLSNDIDFLCTREAYLPLFRAVKAGGFQTLIGSLKLQREVKTDDRGIRTAIVSPETGDVVKFEILHDGYLTSHTPGEVIHGVTCLQLAERAAHKLMANVDRWPERHTALRDYVDLIAIASRGGIPIEGLKMAEEVYGIPAITRCVHQAHDLLRTEGYIKRCTENLKLTSRATENLENFAQVEPEEALAKLVSGLSFPEIKEDPIPQTPTAYPEIKKDPRTGERGGY